MQIKLCFQKIRTGNFLKESLNKNWSLEMGGRFKQKKGGGGGGGGVNIF